MKKLLALILVLAMTLSLVGCGKSSNTSSKTLSIGVFEPASGDNGAGGKQETLGMQYANSVTPTVAINGETYNVVLKIVDNQSTTDKAPTAAQQLVSDGVSVVLGSYGSGVSMAAAPIFEQAKIPAIGASCTNPAVTQNRPYYFRVCFIDPFQGNVMASFVKDQFNAKKAYVLSMLGEDYGSGLATYFANAFKKEGGNLKVYVSTFFDENDKSGVAATFVSGFKAWLNADSQHKTDNGGNDIVAAVSALGYDAYMTAIEAIKIANSTTGEDIKNAMPKVSFDGVTGHISFPNGGDAAKSDAFIKQADNGVFKFVKRQSGAS